MTSTRSLSSLGTWLKERGYRFNTVTPLTHARVNARIGSTEARTLRDVFGWSRPFRSGLLPEHVRQWLDDAGALRRVGPLLGSEVRFSTLDDDIYVHSAFPTSGADTVFFGPDTYRFAALIKRTLAGAPAATSQRVVDIGCGTGAGGMVAARCLAGSELILTDINARALELAAVNTAIARVSAAFVECDLFAGITSPVDVIVANPPYLNDADARLYRHGGGDLGSALSLRILREGLPHLRPGGRMILYTGSPIVEGVDALKEEVAREMQGWSGSWSYSEIDPDVFGEELELSAYARVERIAVVGLIVSAAGADAVAPVALRGVDAA